MNSKESSAASPGQKRNLANIARSVAAANRLQKLFTDHPAETFQVLLREIGHLAFESALRPKNDAVAMAIRKLIEDTERTLAARIRSGGGRKR